MDKRKNQQSDKFQTEYNLARPRPQDEQKKDAASYLNERANRADREAFHAILDSVPARPPIPDDEL